MATRTAAGTVDAVSSLLQPLSETMLGFIRIFSPVEGALGCEIATETATTPSNMAAGADSVQVVLETGCRRKGGVAHVHVGKKTVGFTMTVERP